MQNISEQRRFIVLSVYCLGLCTFAVGGTFLIGLFLNLTYQLDTKNTWLESHHKWQIRTALFTILWAVIGLVMIFIFIFNENSEPAFILALIGGAILAVTLMWFAYRNIIGLYKLNQEKPMYCSVKK